MSQPRGWHTDPSDSTKWRFWDGAEWTEQRRPKASGGVTTGPPPPVPLASVPAVRDLPENVQAGKGLGRFFGRKTDDQKAARVEYEALLRAMVAGSVDLHQLPGQLRQLADTAGLRDRKASKLQ